MSESGKSGKFSSFPGETGELDAGAMNQDGGYRPVSVVAIFGALLGALYALAFLGGFGASFALGTPWLMPVWSLAFPIAAMLVSGLALVRIRTSDGTLGGGALSLWTLRGTAVLILCYFAHFAATYFAVRAQGDNFGRQWMDLVTKGELDRAFLLTLKPPRPAEDANLRNTLEITYNIASDPSGKGPYSTFKGKEIIRLMQQGGADAKMTLKSASSPTYELGGYLVRMVYQVEVPDGVFDLALMVLGMESPTGAFKGRQWQVVLDGTGMSGKMKPREESHRKLELTLLSAEFAAKWCQAVSNKIWEVAVPFTLAPALQEKALKGGVNSKLPLEVQAAGGSLVQFADSEERKEFLLAAQELFSGKLVKVTDKFWSDPTMRPTILKDLYSAFSPLSDFKAPGNFSGNPDWLKIETNVIPKFQKDGNKISFGYDCLILLFPKYQLLGTLYVEAEEETDPNKPVRWQVRELQVHRAVSMPVSSKKGG